MTGWSIAPGTWEITQGIDSKNDDKADRDITTRTALFERSRSLDFTFPPRSTTVLTLDLKQPGTPYWQRPDLGLSTDDVQVNGREVRVKLHSLGSVTAPPTTVAFRDASGKIVASVRTKPIAAPLDLLPKTDDITLSLPEGSVATGGRIEIDPDHELTEITLLNNTVKL